MATVGYFKDGVVFEEQPLDEQLNQAINEGLDGFERMTVPRVQKFYKDLKSRAFLKSLTIEKHYNTKEWSFCHEWPKGGTKADAEKHLACFNIPMEHAHGSTYFRHWDDKPASKEVHAIFRHFDKTLYDKVMYVLQACTPDIFRARALKHGDSTIYNMPQDDCDISKYDYYFRMLRPSKMLEPAANRDEFGAQVWSYKRQQKKK